MARLMTLLIVFICIPFGLITIPGCAGTTAPATVALGDTFTIGVGQSARIPAEEMSVAFHGVIGDSRCPENVTCIWEGIASSNVTITLKGVDYALVLDEPGLTDKAEYTFNEYNLTFNLSPYPREGVEITPNEYRLTLTVTK